MGMHAMRLNLMGICNIGCESVSIEGCEVVVGPSEHTAGPSLKHCAAEESWHLAAYLKLIYCNATCSFDYMQDASH
jgi:hypothetical protein